MESPCIGVKDEGHFGPYQFLRNPLGGCIILFSIIHKRESGSMNKASKMKRCSAFCYSANEQQICSLSRAVNEKREPSWNLDCLELVMQTGVFYRPYSNSACVEGPIQCCRGQKHS